MDVPAERGLKLEGPHEAVRALPRGEMNVPDERGLKRPTVVEDDVPDDEAR